jgi:hypothetical protein
MRRVVALIISTAIFLFLYSLSIWAALRRDASERSRDLVAVSAPAVFVLGSSGRQQSDRVLVFPSCGVRARVVFPAVWSTDFTRCGWIGRAAIAMLPVLVVAKWAVDSRIRAPQIEWSRHFVEELRRVVPENEPVFQIDASGWVGWFSSRHIVNGDAW